MAISATLSSSPAKEVAFSVHCVPLPFLLLHCTDPATAHWQPHRWQQELQDSKLVLDIQDPSGHGGFLSFRVSESSYSQLQLTVKLPPGTVSSASVEILVSSSTQIVILEMPFQQLWKEMIEVRLGVSGKLLPSVVTTQTRKEVDSKLETVLEFLRGQLSGNGASVLITGNSGSGKTFAVRSVAMSLKMSVLSVSASVLFARGKQYCDRLLFDLANAALVLAPCVLLLEDLHSLVPRKVLDSNYSACYEATQSFLTRLVRDVMPATRGMCVVAACEKDELVDKHVLSLFPEHCLLESSRENKSLLFKNTHNTNEQDSKEPIVGIAADVLAAFDQICIWPRTFHALFSGLGIRGGLSQVLFLGPSGTGKTSTARRLAKQHDFFLVEMSLNTVMRSDVGGSERQIRGIFTEAKARVPSMVLIDEFEAMFGKGDEGSQNTLASTLIACLDEISEWNRVGGVESQVLVVATSRAPSGIDGRFLQEGRLASGVFFGHLSTSDVEAFLRLILRDAKLSEDFESEQYRVLLSKIRRWTVSDFNVLRKRVLFEVSTTHQSLSAEEKLSILTQCVDRHTSSCREKDFEEILSWAARHRSFAVVNADSHRAQPAC